MTLTLSDDDWTAEIEPSDFGSTRSKQERSETAMARPCILVIDDDATFCELLTLYFMAKGFDVVAAGNASQADRLIAEGRFDLVILDWYLNGADALGLLNFSKTKYPEIPVIVFTGAEVEVFLKTALGDRVQGVIRKMGSLEALSSQVCQHLGWPELRIVK